MMTFLCPLCGNEKTIDEVHPLSEETVSHSRPIRILCGELGCKGWMPKKIGVIDGV